MTSSLASQLAGVAGAAHVAPATRLDSYAVDGLTPQAVACPADRNAVSEVMKWASAQGVAVAPRGGGTQADLGNVPSRLDVALDVTGCNRLLDFQPQDLTVTVEAGMTLEALQRELAQGGKSLLIEAPRPADSTIGGLLASGFTGPRRSAYGLPRDWLIGIGVVGADGTQTKAGGRVVKNVTGYDLNKLYAGSLGTLGIIVEASFKLAPAPLCLRAVAAVFEAARSGAARSGAARDSSESREQALAAAQRLARQRHPPQGVLAMNAPVAAGLGAPLVREMLAGRGPDQSLRNGGLPDPWLHAPWLVIAFLEGWDEALVEQRASTVLGMLGGAAPGELVQLNQRDSEGLLREITGMGWEADTGPALSMKLDLAPSRVAETLEALTTSLTGPLTRERQAADGHAFVPTGVPAIVADAGFGTVRLFWSREPMVGQAVDYADSLLSTVSLVRDAAHGAGGTAVVERCPPELKRRIDVWDSGVYGQRELQVMHRIKEKFDPAGVLNPGRFLGGI